MNLATILQFLLKLFLLLLTALLPLHQVLAQDAKTDEKKVRVKIIRTMNGKMEMVDTTITAPDQVTLLQGIKGIRLDTAALRGLEGRMKTLLVDVDHPDLHEMAKTLRADTAQLRRLREVRVQMIGADSLMRVMEKRFEIIKIDSLSGTGQVVPRIYFRNDTAGAMRLKEGEAISAINPNKIDRIVVDRIKGRHKTDSLLLKEGKSYVRINTDDKTGDHKVYRIDADGNEMEVKAEDVGVSFAGRGRVIYFVRAQVEDATAEEKKQLKEAGAPVEMKAKEELKVEEINYYPNPNNGRFKLSFTLKNKGTTVVRIMDSKGDEVFVDTVEKLSGEYSREIDISPFGPGIYYLQVAQNDRYHTKKLLVQ
ncbi:T9SS type A sorting domain-containing protein [Pontibacter roseus]|uniref:T9SS type A sorting domain-containing protein n=1 Tax=Pontibacter roseus TaxID=336989 RepID=UPI0003645393|nr:T9SS type A sorting domain-containing protein [Pontibacter roseus]